MARVGQRWTHLIRFIAEEDGRVHLGQVDTSRIPDVGQAMFDGEKIECQVVAGSIYDGIITSRKLHVSRLLSPLSVEQVPIVRCLGLNYRDHAKEANMPIPDVPVLFIKPRTSINDPFPSKISIPRIAQDDTADYEAELTMVISKNARDIPKSEVHEYILGYTCGNDVSARTQQLKNSQWCFGKGMDSSAPIGPVLVSSDILRDADNLRIKAIHNSTVVQDTNTREMIFNICQIVSFLSQGTTLEQGTVIMTGTGPGIGMARQPKVVLRNGDDMRVFVEGIGTLINEVYYE